MKEWWVEDGKLRSPNGDPAGFSKRDVLNGLEPWDIPNKTDEPITGKEMEVYKCHGQVVLGYKENCPVDYELSAPERMLQSLSTLWEEMRSSPFCSETCQAIGLAPAIMAGLCSAVTIFPVPTPLVVAGKATCAALGMSQAWQIQAVLFAGTTSGAIGSISACKRICTTKE